MIKKLLLIITCLTAINCFAQTPVIDIVEPSVPVTACPIRRIADAFCLNRANCCYRVNERWRGITYPSNNVELVSGNKLLIQWDQHPAPYLRGYILSVFSSSTGSLVFCQDVGYTHSKEVSFCSPIPTSGVRIEVVAYADKDANINGGKTTVEDYFLCMNSKTAVIINDRIISAIDPQQEAFCKDGDYTLVVPEHPQNPNYNVYWYNNINDNQANYVHQGRSYTRYFSNTTNLYFSYVDQEGDCEFVGDKSIFTMIKYPAVPVLAPAPEEIIVCKPGVHDLTVSAPPIPDYDIIWYENFVSPDPIGYGRSIRKFVIPGIYTFFISYVRKDLCETGVDESARSMVTVVVLDDYNVLFQPDVKVLWKNEGAKTYNIIHKPSQMGLTAKWYSNYPQSVPDHVGNNYSVFLNEGMNVLYYNEFSEECQGIESPISFYIIFVVNFKLTHPLAILEPNLRMSVSPNPAVNNAHAILSIDDIEIKHEQFSNGLLEIFDDMGNKIQSLPYQTEGVDLNLSNFKKGNYNLILNHNDFGVLARGRFAKE